jgi:hypothetical protein
MPMRSFEIKAPCPQCGAQLSIDFVGPFPEPETPLVCAVHGQVGIFEDIRQQVLDQAGEQIADEYRKKIEEMFRTAGFKMD